MRSGLSRTTHFTVDGGLQPTRTPLRQTTRQGEQNDFKPLKTGALDRTVRLGAHGDERRLQNQDFPPAERSPVRERQIDHSRAKKDPSSEEDVASESTSSTESQHRKKPREQMPALARKQGNRRSSPKRSESDDGQKLPTRVNKTTQRTPAVKPTVQSESSSDEEVNDRRGTNRRSQLPPAAGRGPLPKLSESSTPDPRVRQGNQTIPARPTADNRTRTLATPDPSQDRNQNSAINEAQPGFVSRLFSPKQPPVAPPVTQNDSKTCSVMWKYETSFLLCYSSYISWFIR